jgi:NAD(P)-dependent dehydrogenase (short-subunit alcohol dehydrogenase family)
VSAVPEQPVDRPETGVRGRRAEAAGVEAEAEGLDAGVRAFEAEAEGLDAGELAVEAEAEAEGLDAGELALALRVLAAAERLPIEHADALAIQRATASLYKTVKRRRRSERRGAIRANDEAVTAATATGADGRIDDETRGLPLVGRATGESAGTLLRARACYVCKQRYTEVDAFYHQLCPACATRHRDRREARTDLRGRRALLTGGRAKIGMYIALRLLRDGAHTTITTRFPRDAARRFAATADSPEWLERLRIVGIDLRSPAAVEALAESVAERGPLDILINNAAQTVRRSPGAYAALAAAEEAGPWIGAGGPEIVWLGPPGGAHPGVLVGSDRSGGRGSGDGGPNGLSNPNHPSGPSGPSNSNGLSNPNHPSDRNSLSNPNGTSDPNSLSNLNGPNGPNGTNGPSGLSAPAGTSDPNGPSGLSGPASVHAVTALALTAGSASGVRIAGSTAIDAGGLVPDLEASNSWVARVEEVDPLELLEVQLCNVTAPFILVSRLRPALAASRARRKYVVNVSAMEGQFSRGYKGPGHPHTNMAKAALNMLTRTSAQEMLETDGILMTSVDTGWITDERPHPTKMRLADAGFHAPLDLVDGAARVYDPIVRGEAGEDVYGCFLKDYEVSAW